MESRWICDDPKNETELCLNQAFVKDGTAWYRDFQRELPARGFVREIIRQHIGDYEADALTDDEVFDDAMEGYLFDGTETIRGVCAILYFLLVGAAENREKVKKLEVELLMEKNRPSPQEMRRLERLGKALQDTKLLKEDDNDG